MSAATHVVAAGHYDGDGCTFPSPGHLLPSSLADVLAEITAERTRQDEKWGEQNHPDGTGDDVRLLGDIDLPTYGTLAYRAKALVDSLAAKGRSQYAPILLEEVFEALSALSEDELRTELVQVAAVCVQWVQAIDRRAR